MNRKIYYWKLRTTELQLGERTLVMGILNLTPDSFSDGGRFLDAERAYARALEMEEQGVDIIDIGAESTRPESKRISADEEWQRLVPVLKKLKGTLQVPISLDTYKSEVAERAMDYGVEILNDPSGLTFDAGLAKVAANANAGLILNHMRGTPETWGSLPPLPDVTGSILKDLDATTSRARRAGVEKSRILVDPGLGFGKRKEQNSEVLGQLGRLAALDYPILTGPSRKSFLTHTGDGGETIFATAAAVTASILRGAHIVRVHDVKEMRAVVLMADEIAKLSAVPTETAEEAEDRAKTRSRNARTLPPYMGEEKRTPMRPPVRKPVAATSDLDETKNPVAQEEIGGSAVGEDLVERIQPAEAAEGTAAAARDSAVNPAEAESPKAEPAKTAGAPAFVRRPVQDTPSKGWGPAPIAPRKPFADREPRKDFGDRPSRPPFGDRGPRKDFGDRPSRPPFGDRGPRKDFGDRPSRPPFGDREPRKDFGDRPSRPPFGDRGPRKDFGDRPSRPPFGDRGPKKDFGDRPSRPPFGDREPRKDFGDRPSRPPFGDRGPRKDFGDRPSRPPFGDRGPRKDFGDRPSRPPFGDRGPKKDFGDRPPRPPFGDRGPRKDFGDRPSRPPFGDRSGSKDSGDRGPRPPFGGKSQGPPSKRPFRKRP